MSHRAFSPSKNRRNESIRQAKQNKAQRQHLTCPLSARVCLFHARLEHLICRRGHVTFPSVHACHPFCPFCPCWHSCCDCCRCLVQPRAAASWLHVEPTARRCASQLKGHCPPRPNASTCRGRSWQRQQPRTAYQERAACGVFDV